MTTKRCEWTRPKKGRRREALLAIFRSMIYCCVPMCATLPKAGKQQQHASSLKFSRRGPPPKEIYNSDDFHRKLHTVSRDFRAPADRTLKRRQKKINYEWGKKEISSWQFSIGVGVVEMIINYTLKSSCEISDKSLVDERLSRRYSTKATTMIKRPQLVVVKGLERNASQVGFCLPCATAKTSECRFAIARRNRLVELSNLLQEQSKK